jgi:hypothetical protein
MLRISQAYYILMTFLSTSAKYLSGNAAATSEERYERDMFDRKYPILSQFAKDFRSEISQSVSSQLGVIKQSKQEKKMLRSRVVSVETFKYMTAYLEFVLVNLRRIVRGVDRNWPRIE